MMSFVERRARHTSKKAAQRACYQSLARGSRSFWMATRLLPASCREEVAALYAWCRRCDDAIDDAPAGQSETSLARIRAELDSVYSPVQPAELTLRAFQEVVCARKVPREYPEELLEGMRMDVAGVRYESMDDLLLYCYRVAGTVGLMACHLFEVTHSTALRRAAHLGMAMQLTNICRDVLEDWSNGRLYIPRELLREVEADALFHQVGRPLPAAARGPLATAVRRLLAEADRFYRSGEAGLVWLPRRCAIAARAARLIYSSIGAVLEGAECNVFSGRAIVPMQRQCQLLIQAAGTSLVQRRAPHVRGYRFNDTLSFPGDVLPLNVPQRREPRESSYAL